VIYESRNVQFRSNSSKLTHNSLPVWNLPSRVIRTIPAVGNIISNFLYTGPWK
jgi:hypothetical protein